METHEASPNAPEALLTIAEAAVYLHMSRSKLYLLTSRRQIPHRKLGRHVRFRRAELDAWIEARQVKVAAIADLPLAEYSAEDIARIRAWEDAGHTFHCACRLARGNGECECVRRSP